MKKIISILIVISCIFLASCKDNPFGLDNIDEIKAEAVESIYEWDLKNINFGQYTEDDVVLSKICKASKESGNFSGEYLIFWESKDGEESDKVIWTNDGEIYNMPNLGLIYEVHDDECEDL